MLVRGGRDARAEERTFVAIIISFNVTAEALCKQQSTTLAIAKLPNYPPRAIFPIPTARLIPIEHAPLRGRFAHSPYALCMYGKRFHDGVVPLLL